MAQIVTITPEELQQIITVIVSGVVGLGGIFLAAVKIMVSLTVKNIHSEINRHKSVCDERGKSLRADCDRNQQSIGELWGRIDLEAERLDNYFADVTETVASARMEGLRKLTETTEKLREEIEKERTEAEKEVKSSLDRIRTDVDKISVKVEDMRDAKLKCDKCEYGRNKS